VITCFFENTNKALLRHVTVDAILVRDNKIILVEHSAHLTNPNKYALPGGFLDRDETIAEGMLREIKEETGHKGKIISLFRVNSNPDRIGEDRQNVDFVFLVEAGKKVSKPDKEIKKTVWFNLNSLPNPKEFAFDHHENIEMYLKYLKEKFPLPIID